MWGKLRYVGKIWKNTCKDLTVRTATLLSILWGSRAREIITAMDIRNSTVEENHLVISIWDALKDTSKQLHTGEVKFPVTLQKKTHAESILKPQNLLGGGGGEGGECVWIVYLHHFSHL